MAPEPRRNNTLSTHAEREAIRRAWREREAESNHLFDDPLVRKKIAELIVRAARKSGKRFRI